MPGALEPAVLTRMGLTAGPVMGLSAIVSMAVYSRHDLTREKHAAILQEIAARRPRGEGQAAE